MKAKNDVITLVHFEEGEKKNGIYTKGKRVETQVFASVDSVKRTEYYQALRDGIKADVIFTMMVDDYDTQTTIMHDNKTYRVVRMYRTDEYEIELTCAEVD